VEMIVYDSKTVSRKSRFLVNAETALIRKYMEQNLELGKTHQDIMNELQIKPATYYRHVKRIIDQDSKIWDKVHMDSAKYRAQRLVDDLLSCVNLCKQIMNDPKEKAADRIEASKTLCIAETNIFKLINEGPVFRISVPLFPKDKNQQALTEDNN
jgi:hypothetical protein